MANSKLTRIGSWALNVGGNSKSLEPTRRAAANGWFQGRSMTSPPAIAKQRHLLRVLKARKHSIFVEAGTYRGETTAFIAAHAKKVYSVELHDGLYAAAVQRFADQPNVTIVHGDSLLEIPRIVGECTGPPLVFLDGHFSGTGTASGIEMEPAEATLAPLAAVAPPGTTIVIDDLRLFGTSKTLGFPQLDQITAAARRAFPDAVIRTGLDSIVVETPR